MTISGGAISNTSGLAVTLSSAVPETWSGSFTFGGNNPLNLGAGAVTLTVSPTITTNGTSALTVGGVISGSSFGIVKAGPGLSNSLPRTRIQAQQLSTQEFFSLALEAPRVRSPQPASSR